MPKGFKDVFRDATELSEHDPATLAGLLVESLEDEPDADVEAAWAAEIERRVTELNTGIFADNEVVVVAMVHQKCRPGCWEGRWCVCATTAPPDRTEVRVGRPVDHTLKSTV